MVFVGLDNAGKTTLLGLLKDGHLRSTKPTFQPSKQEASIGSNHTFRGVHVD